MRFINTGYNPKVAGLNPALVRVVMMSPFGLSKNRLNALIDVKTYGSAL